MLRQNIPQNHAAHVENEASEIGAFGFAALASAAMLSVATAGAFIDHGVDIYRCRTAFARAHGLPANLSASATASFGNENAQGQSECRATEPIKPVNPSRSSGMIMAVRPARLVSPLVTKTTRQEENIMTLIHLQSESRGAHNLKRQLGVGVLATAFIAAQYGPGFIRDMMSGDKPAPADTRTKVQKKAATAACAQGFDAGMKQQSIDPARLMVMDFDSAVSEGKTLCTANVAAGKYGRVAHSYFLPDAQTPGLK